ncbi:MAG TPA: DUF3800 domain-containing protein [Thiotrichales bacterium]|nr:DUF3800 domain-containing protein [Thiotrichales bacterium]
MTYSDFIIYADESGDHGLKTIDQNYPVFVLNFCIFEKKYYANNVLPEMQNFKFNHFGHDIIILHEHHIRKQKPPFAFLKNQNTRASFMIDLDNMIRRLNFTIIASVIDKRKLAKRYVYPDNPYEIALKFCMERSYAFLRGHGQTSHITHVVVERRGKKEDNQLELAFRRICAGDNKWGQMACFKIEFADKKTNSTGLQLADLTARPIGLRVLKLRQPNRAWNTIRSKLRCSPQGRIDGWGLKIFP